MTYSLITTEDAEEILEEFAYAPNADGTEWYIKWMAPIDAENQGLEFGPFCDFECAQSAAIDVWYGGAADIDDDEIVEQLRVGGPESDHLLCMVRARLNYKHVLGLPLTGFDQEIVLNLLFLLPNLLSHKDRQLSAQKGATTRAKKAAQKAKAVAA